MKVFTSWLRSVALATAMLLVGAEFAQAQVTLSLNDISGRPGESATVAVDLAGVAGGTAIQSYNFTVTSSNANIELAGIDYGAGTLAAGFNNNNNAAVFPTNAAVTVGGFALGTNITTAGTLANLTFNFKTAGTATITLTGVVFNAGDPAVAGDFAADVLIASRFLLPSTHTVRKDDTFQINLIAQDAFVVADDVISYNVDLTYDPAMISLNLTSAGAGLLNPSWTVVASGGAGTVTIGAFGTQLVGAGTIASITATALAAGNSALTLSNAVINAGTPVYALAAGSVTVTLNVAPMADDIARSVDEDGSVDITLTGTDADSDPLTFDLGTAPTNGGYSLAGSVVTYIPNPGYNGPDSFTFTANDGIADSAPGTVSITVNAVNDPPVFTAEMTDQTVLEDDAVAFTYAATDPDLDPLTFAIVTGPTGATIDGTSGAFSWMPVGQAGDHVVTVSVTDGTDTVTTTATITVNPVDGFSSVLSGVHEIPAVSTPASGWLMIRLVASTSTLELTASVSGLSSNYTAAHLHLGAVGENGGPVVALSGTMDASKRNVTFNQTIDLSGVTYPAGVTEASFVAALQSGGAYMNVHTAGNASGELRGQILGSGNRAPDAATIRTARNVDIAGNPHRDAFSVTWLEATDPDGDAINYLLETSTNTSFTEVIGLDNFGTDTGFDVSMKDAADLFDELSGGAPGSVKVGESVTFYMRLITTDGSLQTVGSLKTVTMTRGLVTSNEEGGDLPTEFSLKGNYPNPFNPSTSVQFDLPMSADVTVTVVDMLGRQVLSVPSQQMDAGANRSVQLDASALTSGVYLYRVVAQSADNLFSKVGTMTLIK